MFSAGIFDPQIVRKQQSAFYPGREKIKRPLFQRVIQTNVVNAKCLPRDAVASAVRNSLNATFPVEDDTDRQKKTPRIAIGVGSRGIANIDAIVKSVVDTFKARNYDVFLVPAMGSHGGSNAAGQTLTLAHYGITADSMGVPIEASMETVEVARSNEMAVGCAQVAWRDDTLLFPINRIKAHTNILATDVQSGLRKMLLIGFGKRNYAQVYHAINGTSGLGPVIETGAQLLLDTGHVLGGLAIVDGPNLGTHLVEAVSANDFMSREPQLLKTANELMPTLPFEKIGVLHLGQIGKAIAGSSADPNVTSLRLDGTRRVKGKGSVPIGIVCASKPHPDTDGNVIGIGRLDVVTQELADARGPATYENAKSAGTNAGIEPDLILPHDQDMLSYCLAQSPRELPFVSIRDTLSLGELIVDVAAAKKIANTTHIELQGEPFTAEFQTDGQLANFWVI